MAQSICTRLQKTRVPRGKDQSLGVAWNELGCAYLQNDTTLDAEECFKKSIDSLGALEGATRRDLALTRLRS